MQVDKHDEYDEADEPHEHAESDVTEEYVPGTANGLNFMARLTRVGDGPWSVDVVHIEGRAPLHGAEGTWATKAEATAAATQMVAALAH
jgi:hypothetical protein